MSLWRWASLVVISLLLAACVSAPKVWYGESTHRLFKVYGYPTRIARLRSGWCLLIYKTKDMPCETTFKVDRNRIIRGVRRVGGKKCLVHHP